MSENRIKELKIVGPFAGVWADRVDRRQLVIWVQTAASLAFLFNAGTYAANTGRPSDPLLTLFRGLLPGVWYRLSDVQLAQCIPRPVIA